MNDPKKEDGKPGVFICYAQEDHDLFLDFVERLEAQVGDRYELWHDQTPHSGNFHKRFEYFANHCKVAVLLVSPRFTRQLSYANKRELPILLERQKKNEVGLIGVCFMHADYEEWNENGDVYFLQLKNNQLPSPESKTNEDQYAVYESIFEKDRNFYHLQIKKWIYAVEKQLITPNALQSSRKSAVIQPDEEPLDEESDKWMDLISLHLYPLESKLRAMKDRYFKENDFQDPKANESFVQVFLEKNLHTLTKFRVDLNSCDIDQHHFHKHFISIYTKPKTICIQLNELLEPLLPINSSLLFQINKMRLLVKQTDSSLHKVDKFRKAKGLLNFKHEILVPLMIALDELLQELDKFMKENLKKIQN
jgi:hypothetical protein